MKPVAVRKPVPLRDPIRVVTKAEIHSHVTAGPQGAGTVAAYRFHPQCVLLPSWSPGTLTPQTAPRGRQCPQPRRPRPRDSLWGAWRQKPTEHSSDLVYSPHPRGGFGG